MRTWRKWFTGAFLSPSIYEERLLTAFLWLLIRPWISHGAPFVKYLWQISSSISSFLVYCYIYSTSDKCSIKINYFENLSHYYSREWEKERKKKFHKHSIVVATKSSSWIKWKRGWRRIWLKRRMRDTFIHRERERI